MDQRSEADLNAAILAAHENADSYLLAQLYERAAVNKREQGDMEACWFLTTHAYVFALESAHPSAPRLHQSLKAAGRDE